VNPRAFYRSAAGAVTIQGLGFATAQAGIANVALVTSGLDNLIYIELTSGVLAPQSALNSGVITFSGLEANRVAILNSGVFTRISDTELVIKPGSGLTLLAAAGANAQGIGLTSGAFVRVAASPDLTVASSFVNPLGVKAALSVHSGIVVEDDTLTITSVSTNGPLFKENITAADITFSGLNATVFAAANITRTSETVITITGFTNLVAATGTYEIIFKESAFIRGSIGDPRTATFTTINAS
jgi:hypothetical protein